MSEDQKLLPCPFCGGDTVLAELVAATDAYDATIGMNGPAEENEAKLEAGTDRYLTAWKVARAHLSRMAGTAPAVSGEAQQGQTSQEAAPELRQACTALLSLIRRNAPDLSGKVIGDVEAALAQQAGGGTDTGADAQAPKEVFLQLYGESTADEGPVNYEAGDVSWCWHKVYESDVRYVQADPSLPALRAVYEAAKSFLLQPYGDPTYTPIMNLARAVSSLDDIDSGKGRFTFSKQDSLRAGHFATGITKSAGIL